MIRLKDYSSIELKRAAAEASGEYTLLILNSSEIISVDVKRLEQVARDTRSNAVYGNYLLDGHLVPLIEMQPGSVRDDFDFGPVMLVNTIVLKDFARKIDNLNYSAFYAFWLSMHGSISFVPEPVSSISSHKCEAAEGEAQFNYVDPRNRDSQLEKEQVFTEFLFKQRAAVEPGREVRHSGEFPVEASVIIPVRNRVNTIADAIASALSQVADFDFNIIVVDNGSDDGTTETVSKLAESNAKVIHIIPEPGHGIGGCWNVALDSPHCGRFAVQLDSDDVYSSELTLQTIVDKFRDSAAACVIGAYTLTDFELHTISPGLIDHAEWTDSNGANNALRINGLGAPRAYYTPIARELRFPDVSYGEDYAMVLRISREYKLARIYESLYYCRRWGGNSDSHLTFEKINANNRYKDYVRSVEFLARKK